MHQSVTLYEAQSGNNEQCIGAKHKEVREAMWDFCLSGERPECGEGGTPAGGQHDPAGRQQPHGESRHGRSKP